MTRSMSARAGSALLLLLAFTNRVCAADPDSVQRAIKDGQQAVLSYIDDLSDISYISDTSNGTIDRVRGRVIHDTGGVIEFETLDGKKLRIEHKLIQFWIKGGHVRGEMGPPHSGGPSALAAFALLSSGVETTNRQLSALIAAIADDEDTNVAAGTYVRSLRCLVWNTLLNRPISGAHRQRYRKYLNDDLGWLRKNILKDGSYTYSTTGDLGDNSNSQFAVLGLWAAAVAKGEVPDGTWRSVEGHWVGGQSPNGGWAYWGSRAPSPSMTVAGCNSLYILLDRFYARADAPYAPFKGAKPRKAAREAMQRLHEAIQAGDKFLAKDPPDIKLNQGYEFFGLERLGVASGRAILGGKDWFRAYVDDAVAEKWGHDVIADSFALIFLAHGAAPVLFQKLEHGTEFDDWNYYHRDLFTLTRFMSKTYERLVRWQIVSADAELHEMQDAPFLYIAGQKSLEIEDRTLETIRKYVDSGGTLFLHADLASQEFVDSARAIFEKMFADRGYKFVKLKPTHPVYSCHFGGNPPKWKEQVPFWAMNDGSRIIAFLCPVDIAGAWHQDRSPGHDDLFKIMANIRTYAAPPYGELPSVLRLDPLAGPPAPLRGKLVIGRLSLPGVPKRHPNAWTRYAESVRHRQGLTLDVREGVKPEAAAIRDCDVLVLSAAAEPKLTPEMTRALTNYLDAGGMLLVDAVDGRDIAVQAVRALSDALVIGDKGVLGDTHPIVTGAISGGKALVELATTSAGAALSRGRAPPPIFVRNLRGRPAVLLCAFDLLAGLENHFVPSRRGYLHEPTERIVDNILLWRGQQTGKLLSVVASRPTSHPATSQPTSAPARPARPSR